MDENIYINIAKMLDGEATEAERQEIDAWLLVDPKHKALFENLKLAWQQSGRLFEQPVFDAAPAWEKIAVRMQPAVVTPDLMTSTPKRVIAFPAWAGYSLAAAAALLIGLFLFTRFSHQTVTVAALESNKHIILPDQSVIDLRKGSTIRYPESFAANERKVELEGEAYFDVVHKERQPFIVNTRLANIKVLGTSFNVSCGNEKARVEVTSGSVQMTSRSKAGPALILKKGEKGVLENGLLIKQPITDENFLYWKTGLITFTNESLEKVVAEMSKLTGDTIQLDTHMPAIRKQQLVNISFHNQSLKDMLTDLCLIAECQWSGDSNSYIIRTK